MLHKPLDLNETVKTAGESVLPRMERPVDAL